MVNAKIEGFYFFITLMFETGEDWKHKRGVCTKVTA